MAITTLTDYISSTRADFFYIKNNSVIRTVESFDIIDSVVIEPYIKILKNNALVISLSDKEIEMYRYKPRLLSKLIYGTENLYWILLFLNDMTVEEFVPKNIYVLTSSNRSLIETIINKERSLGTIK